MTAAPQHGAADGVRHSKRTEALENRPVNLDGFVEEWPEAGMVAMDSAFDPAPSVRVADGLIVEVHPEPEVALCDGPQALTTAEFAGYADDVWSLAGIMRPVQLAAA